MRWGMPCRCAEVPACSAFRGTTNQSKNPALRIARWRKRRAALWVAGVLTAGMLFLLIIGLLVAPGPDTVAVAPRYQEPALDTTAAVPTTSDCTVDPQLILRLAKVDREWANGSFVSEVEIVAEGSSLSCNEHAEILVAGREEECEAGRDAGGPYAEGEIDRLVTEGLPTDPDRLRAEGCNRR